MSKNKKGNRDENSVNVALNDLMGLEDERTREEEERRRLAEEAKRKKLEEEKRMARKEKEQEHLAREKAAREESERKERERQEQEIRIREQEAAKAREREHQRMLEFELEMKRISAGKSKTPAWLIPTFSVILFGLVGVGVILYTNVKSSAELQVESITKERLQAEEELNDQLSHFQALTRSYKEQLDKAEKEKDNLSDRIASLESAPTKPEDKPIRNAGRGPVRGGKPKPPEKSDKDAFIDGLDMDNPAGEDKIPE